jgi:hypothetical protein
MVLHGEALLPAEGRERPLRTWNVVRWPPQTEHAFVVAGERPCAILTASPKMTERLPLMKSLWRDLIGSARPLSSAARSAPSRRR